MNLCDDYDFITNANIFNVPKENHSEDYHGSKLLVEHRTGIRGGHRFEPR